MSLLHLIWLMSITGTTCLRHSAADPGVSDAEIKIGMVNAQSGPASALGKGMRVGAEAVFAEVNEAGGVNGRKIRLVVADDGYEPDRAIDATEKMIEEEKVFALFGYVGTPTSSAVLPIVNDTHVPLVGLFTGSMALRKPVNHNVVNFRASYNDEAEVLIDHFVKSEGAKRFGVFYQDDGFGQAVLGAVERALQRRGLACVGKGTFTRNTLAVDSGLASLIPTKPDVVIMAGTYAPLAAFVKAARTNGLKAHLATVSFVGTNSFQTAVGEAGEDVVISQVVPFPGDMNIPIVKQCADILARRAPSEHLGFVNLEGAITAKLLVLGLTRAGKDLSRDALIQALEGMNGVDLGGLAINLSKEDHQASRSVFLTAIHGGKVVPVQ